MRYGSDHREEEQLVKIASKLEKQIRQPRCKVILLNSDKKIAQLFSNCRIVLSRADLAKAAEIEAKAFILAHEIAHDVLGHTQSEHFLKELNQELEADSFAYQLLGQAGYDQIIATGKIRKILLFEAKENNCNSCLIRAHELLKLVLTNS
jgi:predicted Zn-dependent protease